MKHTSSRVLFAVGSLALFLTTGCNTPTDTAAKPAAKPAAATDEYVTLEPEIGSRVKKRVKKSEVNGYVGMSPNSKQKVTADTDMNNMPPTTTGQMEQATGNR
jgi:hypothetical protein